MQGIREGGKDLYQSIRSVFLFDFGGEDSLPHLSKRSHRPEKEKGKSDTVSLTVLTILKGGKLSTLVQNGKEREES